jgi:hypothetical protein
MFHQITCSRHDTAEKLLTAITRSPGHKGRPWYLKRHTFPLYNTQYLMFNKHAIFRSQADLIFVIALQVDSSKKMKKYLSTLQKNNKYSERSGDYTCMLIKVCTH